MNEGVEEGAWWPCVDASGLVEHWWLPSRYALRGLVGRGTYGVCATVWCAETQAEYVVKRVQLESPNGEVREWTEDVCLYEPEDFDALLVDAGLELVARFGGLNGEPFDEGALRQIVIARKS